MCIPNIFTANRFHNLTCPDDNMPHFTVNFIVDSLGKGYIGANEPVTEKAYEANVHFNYDEAGNVLSIDVCLIAPMPDCDPNEPIPYEVTDEGREALGQLSTFEKDRELALRMLGYK